jgi:hypothetical protein
LQPGVYGQDDRNFAAVRLTGERQAARKLPDDKQTAPVLAIARRQLEIALEPKPMVANVEHRRITVPFQNDVDRTVCVTHHVPDELTINYCGPIDVAVRCRTHPKIIDKCRALPICIGRSQRRKLPTPAHTRSSLSVHS